MIPAYARGVVSDMSLVSIPIHRGRVDRPAGAVGCCHLMPITGTGLRCIWRMGVRRGNPRSPRYYLRRERMSWWYIGPYVNKDA